MKLLPLLLAVLLLPGAGLAHAAPAATLGVTVSPDSVVFRFVPSQFRMTVSGRTSRWTRLRDLAVHEVTVAGPWNQWSTEAWPLHRAGRAWELHCPLTAVADHDTVAFKFVVNGEYWVQPPSDCPNQLNAGVGDTTMNLFFLRPRR